MSELEQVSLTIGGLLARTERLENDVQKIMKGQEEILKILHNAQGSWKAMVAVGGITAVIVTGIIEFWSTIRTVLVR